MRVALVGAGMVLMAGMLAGCGDDAPENASKEDFCDAFEAVGSAGDDFDKGKERLQDLKDTGTPEDIPDDAREGFDILLGVVEDADSADEVDKAAEDLSKEDTKKVEAFTTYTIKKCTDLGDLPSEMPSDMPTELPSDIPSDLLSPTS
ncbi:hypothetical protein EKO23_02195 [Nocardioides guangzhouensis]|uniref:Lipoprotein n=1 Tax=Nocardioides guangzhouensis TaxID=2497878 RepID=A0A4Q4ZMM4_9ACTN|nr:hypothetical protein [Nocardioides guangzhouensis]RYP88714.1 hypothetical protein EKO23_02195 [Nocardioides guangzhouensis]